MCKNLPFYTWKRPSIKGVYVDGATERGAREAGLRAYCATQPPSMFQATPRTWLAASLHRNAASAPS